MKQDCTYDTSDKTGNRLQDRGFETWSRLTFHQQDRKELLKSMHLDKHHE